MRSSVLLASLLVCAGAQAQSTGAADRPCSAEVATSDLSQCLDQAWKAADKKLNETYTRIQKVLSPEEAKSLTKAQRLWVQFRDANCQAERDLYGGGSGGPAAHLACLEAETRAREASLKRSFWWQVEKSSK